MSIALTACRFLWPRHTAKHMSRRYGRAVVTTKLWLSRGIPEYQIQTVLADVDQELARYEQDLSQLRAELRRARLAEAQRTRSASGSAGDASAEVVRAASEGNQ